MKRAGAGVMPGTRGGGQRAAGEADEAGWGFEGGEAGRQENEGRRREK